MTDLPIWLQHFEENCKKHRVSFVLAAESRNLNNLLLECIKHSVARWRIERIQNFTDSFEVQDICAKYLHLHTKMLLHDDENWSKIASQAWGKIRKGTTFRTIQNTHFIKSCIYSHYSNESSIEEYIKGYCLKPNLAYDTEGEVKRIYLEELQMINKYVKKYGDINE